MQTKRLIGVVALGLGLTLALLWLLGSPGTKVSLAYATDLTVCPAGPPDCGYGTVQAAVDAAGEGDVIKVAAGTYADVGGRPAPAGYPVSPASGLVTQVVYISKTVTVRGGYTTTNDFADPPDPTANVTTLDAEGQGRVLFIGGNISPTIEGLRITGGNTAGLGGDWVESVGGGMYIISATATISNNQIVSNTSVHGGGGLYLYLSASMLNGNTVVSNTGNYGGGLLLHTSAATFDGNTIAYNIANQAGGGVYLYASAATLSRNSVFSNAASTEGGGLRLYVSHNATLTGNWVYSNTAGFGGGAELRYSDNVTLSGNIVRGNTAGPAANGSGGGLFLFYCSNATLSGNTVQGNTASTVSGGNGGGLYISYGSAVLSGNIIQGNVGSTTSEGKGGGLYVYRCVATLDSNTIISNTATPVPAYGKGGGLCVVGGNPYTLTNNVVADNHANLEGSGMWFGGDSAVSVTGRLLHNTIADNHGCGQGVFVEQYATLAFTNTIIAGHSSVGITVTTGSTVTLEATLWHNNGAITGGGGAIAIGTVNVYGDPAFVNPAAWDYHLSAGSAAIDRGVDAGVLADIDGDSRPIGPLPDLGADEAWRWVYLPLAMRSY